MLTLVRALALALALALASPAAAQEATPGAAMVSLRDRFEAEILAIEGAYETDIDGLRRAAIEIAQRVYGSNWNAVRAEAQRSLAALPTIDLTPYARLEPVKPFSGQDLGAIMPLLGQWGLASMRFWDAQTVAMFTASSAVRPELGAGGAAGLALKMAFVPMRAYRARFAGTEVLATRYMRSLVVAPYSFSVEGLILPDFAGVRVYPLQH